MLPNQVQLRTNIYCQQCSEDKVEIVHLNTPLMEISVNGECSKKELYELGASMLNIMERIPAAKDRLYQCWKEDNLELVISEVGKLKRNLKYGEEVEIGINEETNMISVSIYKQNCEASFHQKDVVSVDTIDLDKLWETADKMGCYYVPMDVEKEEPER